MIDVYDFFLSSLQPVLGFTSFDLPSQIAGLQGHMDCCMITWKYRSSVLTACNENFFWTE